MKHLIRELLSQFVSANNGNRLRNIRYSGKEKAWFADCTATTVDGWDFTTHLTFAVNVVTYYDLATRCGKSSHNNVRYKRLITYPTAHYYRHMDRMRCPVARRNLIA